MKILSMLAAALGSTSLPFNIVNRSFRQATPSKRKGINKDGLPSGYPGAKLARKAMQRAVAVKHPRGLRSNDISFSR